MGKYFTQLIIAHPADKTGPSPKLGNGCNRICGRTSGGFDAIPHGFVQAICLLSVQKGHGAFLHTLR